MPYGAGHRDEEWFVVNLKRLREARGWSQNELATRMRADGWPSFRQTTISRLEKGEQSVRIGEARALAAILGQRLETMVYPPEDAHALEVVHSALYGVHAATAKLRLSAMNLETERIRLQRAIERLRQSHPEMLSQVPAESLELADSDPMKVTMEGIAEAQASAEVKQGRSKARASARSKESDRG
jgi:transcriptional regulator with XRE-family HTH domain